MAAAAAALPLHREPVRFMRQARRVRVDFHPAGDSGRKKTHQEHGVGHGVCRQAHRHLMPPQARRFWAQQAITLLAPEELWHSKPRLLEMLVLDGSCT